jgi:hypothetical protein
VKQLESARPAACFSPICHKGIEPTEAIVPDSCRDVENGRLSNVARTSTHDHDQYIDYKLLCAYDRVIVDLVEEEGLMRTMLVMLAVLGCGAGARASDPARAPDAFRSPPAAATLIRMMDNHGLTAAAAADPAADGTFVAALYIPNGQLLVVSARHPSTDAVQYRIASQQYRDVYLDLQATPTPAGKFFVMDDGADGILASLPNSGHADVVYNGDIQTVFNGDLKSQHLSDADYDRRLAETDARYARLLTLLANALAAPAAVSAR